MPRTFIGIDYAGKPSIKITRNNADDPKTLSDDEWGKFLYNSNLPYFEIPYVTPPGFYNTGGAWQYLPSGTGASNYQLARIGNGSINTVIYTRSLFPEIDYVCPLHTRHVKSSDGKSRTTLAREYIFGASNKGGYKICGASLVYTAIQNFFSPANTSYPNPDYLYIDEGKTALNQQYYETEHALWNLPADTQAIIPKPDLAPVSGQKSIKIKPDGFKIARAGFDVDTAIGDELIFSADQRPVKILAAGDVLIGAGAIHQHDFGFDLVSANYAEVTFYADGGLPTFPADPSFTITGGSHWFSGQSLFIENEGVQCRARYIVYGVDQSAPTGGGNRVFRKANDNGQDYVQILRAGAVIPPNLADTIIDTRYPSLYLLAEQYFPVGNGQLVHTLNFDAKGTTPIVKLMVHRQWNSGYINVEPPSVIQIRSNAVYGLGLPVNWNPLKQSGASVYAQINAANNQVSIHTHRGNPADLRVRTSHVERVEDITPVVGVRAYVFGFSQ